MISNSGTTGNVVAGDFIGTNAAGTQAVPNSAGVQIYTGASANTIGGTVAGSRNVISGNTNTGVDLGQIGTTGNVVLGNDIGTNATGTAALANFNGLVIEGGASLNTIGGTLASAANVVSGNTDYGVAIANSGSSGNLIVGNYLGTGVTGSTAVPNGLDGISIGNQASGNTVGGTVPGSRNVISGNDYAGVEFGQSGTTGNVVLGNDIGTNAAGTASLANVYGVAIASGSSGNTIGGTSSGAGNTIAFNSQEAVEVVGASAAILENLIFQNGFGILLFSGGNNNQIAPVITGVTSEATAATSSQTTISVDLTAAGFTSGSTYSLDFFASALADPTSGVEAHIYLGTQTFTGGATGSVTFTSPMPLLSANETVTATATLLSGSTFTNTSSFATAAPVTETSNFIVTTTNATGAGSLEQAILDANADTTNTTPYTVTFAIPTGSAPYTINLPSSGLTPIARPVVLDATSQPGYAGSPIIVLNGTGISGSGLVLGTGSEGSLISGFDIINFTATGTAGIDIASAGNAVQASYVGIQAGGSAAAGNSEGILITGSNNTIGGVVPGAGDLISGNTTYGVEIFGAGTSGNVVEGDLIGTSAAGTTALGNGVDDLVITNGATGNWIGVNQVNGPDNADQGNVIAGGASVGLLIEGAGTTGNVVAGNLIGLNVGSQGQVIDGLGDGFAGVWIISGASGNWIGVNAAAGPGTQDALQRNVISGSYIDVGMDNSGTTGNVVAGNLIGTDPTGTAAVPNQTYDAPQSTGVYIEGGASSNLIGTSGQDGAVADALERNVISGTTSSGVLIDDQGIATTSNVVAGNFIGTTADGSAALGNSNGVTIAQGASSNWVGVNSVYGPENADQGNLISGNSNAGVYITNANTANNVVAGNDIGTDVTGTKALPNAGHGVAIYDGPQGNIIGTNGDGVADALERNLISGNGQDGVAIAGFTVETDDNVVAGNYIGTDVTGTLPLGNQARGVEVYGMASFNRIGVNPGDVGALAEGNVISANQGFGVWIWHGAASNVVAGNVIGTNAAGTAPLANSAGVEIADGAYNNWIGVNPVYGPENADQGNVIAGNTSNGVNIQDSGTTGNVVAGNLIGLNVNSQGQVIDGLGNGEFGAPVFNGESGVAVYSGASDNWIGVNAADGPGTENALQRNVISGSYLGIAISGTGTKGNVVAGNLIGTDPTGTAAVPNQTYDAPVSLGVDIALGASSNLVGTTGQDGAVADALERNVISGGTYGVYINASGTATTGNIVAGNYIGTTADGSAALGNTCGVVIAQGASNNWVGVNTVYGPANSDQRNTISGNTGDGVLITDAGTTGNTVAGNLVGTDVSGSRALGNAANGILIQSGATNNTIGGTIAGAGNVISGNSDTGIEIANPTTTGNLVQGNLIGLDLSGLHPLGNGSTTAQSSSGIWLYHSPGNTIGGTTAAARNVIAANMVSGIYIYGPDGGNNLVEGNYIGTDATGTVAFGNHNDSITIDTAPNNTIGGLTSTPGVGPGNVLSAATGGSGVFIYGTSGTGNLVEGNLIGTNANGTAALGNVLDGVALYAAPGNTIGGTASGAANVISGNAPYGVWITSTGATGNLVAGNDIGTDITRTVAIANAVGVEIDTGASGNTIGGNSTGARNIISGNTDDGVELSGSGTTGNVVAANYIGTGATGTTSIANGTVFVTDPSGNDTNGGVLIASGASGNLIGTSGEDGTNDALERNVISGNGFTALVIDGAATTGNVVAGNYLGTTPSGESGLSNGIYGDGVDLVSGAHGNWIGVNSVYGAETADQGNLISGNNGSFSVGIYIDPTATGNVVAGNSIGTDSSGASSIPNTVGIDILGPSNLIGTSGQHGAADALERNIISGSLQQGIEITDSTASGNVVAGNLIGTNASGTAALANSVGLLLGDGATANTIGGNVTSAPNIISGNTGDGVQITGANTTANVVAGNLIGTSASGSSALGNANDGVEIDGAPSNSIGGVSSPSRNVISGNANWGIFVTGSGATGNQIKGNYIGLEANGTAALGNGLSGILIAGGSYNTIGGTASGARNVVSGNRNHGIQIGISSNNVVQGNYVGTDVSGTLNLGNSGAGVVLGTGGPTGGATSNLVGGSVPGAGNLISGNGWVGVLILDSGTQSNIVAGNSIGTDVSGSHALGNAQGGILIESGASSNTIGGTTAGAGNVISGNVGVGVEITGPTSTHNVVAGNWIGTNSTGTAALGNAGDGVLIDQSSADTIGGTSTGAGNLISGNTSGVELSDATANLVQGNLIGLDQTGTHALGNSGAGVLLDAGSSSNTIGGASGGARNFISGNAEGVMVTGAATTDTLIAGNFIGTDVKGAVAVGNLTAGIDLAGGTFTTIGGTTALARNLISGNHGDGLDVGSGGANTLIEGNDVGIDETGAKSLGNGGDGLSIDAAPGTTIGGTVHAAGNVISGNAQAGLLIEGAASPAPLVLGNRIGSDNSATTAIGNGTFGIMLNAATGVTIGGISAGDQNIISGNSGAGIGLYAGTTGTLVQGNLIGTDDTGANPLGNATGIQLDGGSSNNTIGGTTSVAGNTIAFSAGIGVDVDATAGAGNAIRLNSIFSNTALGIDLGGNGVTLNNSVPHTGPNEHQNFPVINAVTSAGGTTTVAGTFSSTPSTDFAIDFYTLSSTNASGFGEGRFVLGSAMLATDASGNATFSFPFPTPAGGAQFVTTTATDPSGNTSEFSQEFGIDVAPTARISFTTLTVKVGEPVSFEASASTSPLGDPLSYAWTFGDGTAATGAAPTHTYLAPGTDHVTLTVNDGFGGISTATATIAVVDVPPVFTPSLFTPPLTFTTTAPGNGFGTSVASVDGNVAIGAPSADSTGAVYLFDGVPTDDGVSSTYVYGALIHTFADPSPAPGDDFGASLAVVGNELVVGAPGSSRSGSGNGVAYVFDANPDSTTFGNLLATLSIPDPDAQAHAQFGASVGTTNTNIVIGAPGKDGGRGEIYEFQGDTTQANFGDLLLKVANPGPAPGAQFGAAIAGLGDNVIAAAPSAGTPQPGAFGMVYLFDGTTGSLLSSIANPNESSGFGSSVASVGANIVIGSPFDDTAGPGAGAAFLYNASGGSLTTFVQPDDGGGGFGAAVAGTDNTALIGAPGATLGTRSAGAAYLFDADPTSPTFGQAIAAVQEPTPRSGDLFGAALGFDYGAVIAGAAAAGGTGAEAVDLYQPGALVSASSVTTYAAAAPYDSVILSSTFMDANPSAALTASINWGDGSVPTVLDLPAGSYAFSAPHDYTTDAAARFNIGVTLTDGSGASAFAQTTVAINDPSPEFAAPGLVLSSSSINENDPVTVSGTILSPSDIHTNTVVVDWGDGSTDSTIVLPPGDDTFSAPHTYLNSPPGTASGSFAINASVTNEEGKAGTASTSIIVNKVPPQFTAADMSLSEPVATGGDTITLDGQFTDPGTLESHTVTINWGDGSAPTVLLELLGQVVASTAPGLYTFSAAHQYLNNPPGALAEATDDIHVSVSDAVSTTSAAKSIVVKNATPTVRISSAGYLGSATIALTAVVTNPGVPGTETLAWSLTQNGIVIATATTPTFTFAVPDPIGVLVAAATATDSDGGTGSDSAQIVVIPQSSSSVLITPAGISISTGGGPASIIPTAGANEVLAEIDGSHDRVDASAMNDPVELDGYGGNETLKSGAGNDLLVAGPGANSLVAGSGADTLVSNQGNDSLYGGTGNDLFVINPGPDPLVVGGTAQNTLDFSISSVEISINLNLESGQTQFVASSGGVEYVVTLVGNFDGFIGSSHGDNVTLNNDNDLVYAGSGNNTITGGAGNSTIIGGAGNDLIYTTTGNTTISGGSGHDSIVGGSGNDIIYGGSGSLTLTSGSGSESIVGGSGDDVIYGGSGNITLTGGSGNNSITGGAGNDILYGGSGNTTLTGGGGNSTIVGGTGNDIIYGGASSSSLSGGSGNVSIYGGSGNDIIYGGAGSNTITGGSGNDSITGGSGNDIIYGGSGNTTITGAGGNDTLIGGTGNDVIFGGASSNTLTGGSGGESILGGSGNDIIFGGAGANTITGGTGNDSITGGTGDNIIYGGTGDTTIIGSAGNNTIVGGSGNDIIYITTLNSTISSGGGHDSITGGSGNDIIYGGAGSNTITGGSGNDSITGGSGNDIIYGGSGNTTITGAGGNDTLIGGYGNDFIYGGASTSTLTGGGAGESIVGGSGNDIIYGGAGSDTITGGSGNDSITGGSGNDTIYGGSGNTTITGAGGNNSITGGSGNDIIYAIAGDNTLTGGSGDDTIFGGSANDTIYGGTGNATIVGGQGSDSIAGGSGNDIIFGGTLASTLTGGSGNDSIFGSNGNDIIYGGTGNTTITGGTGNDSITGGTGNDIIYGGPGYNTISGGGGNVTIVGGVGYDSNLGGGTSDTIFATNGNDVLEGSGFDSWLMDFGSQNMTLSDTTLSTSGGGLPASVSTLSGFQNVLLAAGSGDFTLDASAFSGGAILQGGTGNDTLIGSRGPDTLEGGTGNDSLSGGGGGDTFAFNSYSSGSQTIYEPPGGAAAWLDFSQAPAGVSINLSDSAPQAVMPATLNNGPLTLTLADPLGIDNVLGSSYNDTLIGNANDNTLIGGGGDDLIAGLGGNDVLDGGVTRTVFLDFNTDELPGQHVYTPTERDEIQAQLEADYADFSYTFSQTAPQSGPYTTITFNDPVLVGLEGGVASEIDWRNLDISGTATLSAAGLVVVPADSGGVNVNNFLGGPGEPAATSSDFVGLSATIAAHELGHLSGLQHGDSYGPIGSGIFDAVSPGLYNPAYPGPTDANETILHIMASGDSVHSTLYDAINNPFFGEREAIKLAFGEDGSPTNEQLAPHNAMIDAQPLVLAPLVVPNTDLQGTNADTVWDVTAADVVGYLGETNGASNTDFYSFTASAGTLINFQLMSVLLTRTLAPAGTAPNDFNQGPFDTYLAIFNSSGQVIASNDDSFQDADSTIIDLTLPYSGTYYAMVTSSPKSASLGEPLTGDYELFMYTFATGSDPPAGDTMYAGSGNDTIIAGTGDDTIVAKQPQDTILFGSGAPIFASKAPYLDVSAGPDQVVNEGATVNLTGSFIDPSDTDTHTFDWHVVASNGQSIPDGTGPTFSFSPGDAGTYSVSFTVSDQNGGKSSAVVQITSSAVQPVLIPPATPQNGVAGKSTQFDLGALTVQGVGPFTVTVQWGDGQSSSFSPAGSGPLSASHTYGQEGSYTVTETVTDFDGTSTSLTILDLAVIAESLTIASIATVSPNPRNTAVSGVSVAFSVPINLSSLTAGALTLTDNNGPNLITSAVKMSLVSGSTYQLSGLGALTTSNGNYTLTVNAADIDDQYGNPGSGTSSTSWLMDTSPPTSKVNALPQRGTSLTFPVSVTGADSGSPPSGVKSYDIYSSTNGGAWILWTTVPASNPTANLTGQSNTTYAFYSIAHDLAGNTEVKTPTIEASTYLPNLTPPVTTVDSTTGANPSTVNTATGTFTLNLKGSDPGGSVVTYFEVFVSIDSAPYTLATEPIPAGPADSSGNVHATIPYQGLTDGAQHTYAFYSIGIDGAGNTQPAPATPDLTLTETFAAASPAQLQTTSLIVEDGAVERSYIRYLQVDFNESDTQSGGELTQIVNSLKTASPEIQVYQYDLNDDASSKTPVSLAGVNVSVIDHAIELDFGANGLGGSPNTTTADGYYELDIKLPNGATAVHHFYRLLGDVTGDGTVDNNDLNEIAAEINLSNPTGLAPLDANVNGDGTVSALDLTLATRAKGHKLKSGLSLG